MSKVTIPLNWYIDIIRLNDKRFLLFEWFEEEECNNQTLICLGNHVRISLGELNRENIGLSNQELLLKKINHEILGVKQKQVVNENPYYDPYVYFLAKEYDLFGGE